MDPRVDSDRDGSRNMGATGAGYGTSTGTGYDTSTGTGHGTSTGSGLTGSTGSGLTGSTGSGLTGGQSTAGPHNVSPRMPTSSAHQLTLNQSNLLNRADPRVDSDMDGSRRV